MTQTAAFFDLDGTLLRKPSCECRFLFYLLKKNHLGPAQIAAGIGFYFRWFTKFGRDTGRKNKAFYSGLATQHLEDLGRHWVSQNLEKLIHKEIAGHLEACRSAGYTLVLMTGAPDFLAAPIAQALGIDTFIATECVSQDGYFSALPPRQHPLADEKLLLASAWCSNNNVDLKQCTAYGDSHQDYALLREVSRPYAINPDKRMKRLAITAKWPIIIT
jgi:HAD superfamily hydrolase (TIGR01490 family)